MSANIPRRRPFPVHPCAVVSAVVLSLCAIPAGAQTRAAATPPPAQADTPAPQDARAPYEPQLLRLAQIIGTLTYLRDLCGDNDGDKWRAKMASLLAAEATSDSERGRLAGAYNEGFRSYSLTYRTCTANAELVIARYLDEGERLARDVTSRYGGG